MRKAMRRAAAVVLLLTVAACARRQPELDISHATLATLAGTTWSGTGDGLADSGDDVRVTQTMRFFANGTGELDTTPAIIDAPPSVRFTWHLRGGKLYAGNRSGFNSFVLRGGTLVNESPFPLVRRFRQT